MAGFFDQARSFLNNFQPKLVSPQPKSRFPRQNLNIMDQVMLKLPRIPDPAQMLQNAPRLNLGRTNDPVTNFGKGIVEDIADTPRRALWNVAQGTNEAFAGQLTPQRAIGRVAGAAELPLMFFGGAGAVKTVGKSLGKESLKQAAKYGAKQGVKWGAVEGFRRGLNDNMDAPTIQEQFMRSVLTGAVPGAAIGGVLGGAGGAATNFPKASILYAIRHLRPKATPKEVNKIAGDFFRDEAGRFVKELPPQWSGQLTRRAQGKLDSGQWPTKRVPKINAEIKEYLKSKIPQPGLSVKYTSDPLAARARNYKVDRPDAKVNGWIEEGDDGAVAVLDSIDVPFNKQRKGLGSQELNAFEKWAKSQGAGMVSIEAEPQSIGFWRKMGYTLDNQGGELQSGFKRLTQASKGTKQGITPSILEKQPGLQGQLSKIGTENVSPSATALDISPGGMGGLSSKEGALQSTHRSLPNQSLLPGQVPQLPNPQGLGAIDSTIPPAKSNQTLPNSTSTADYLQELVKKQQGAESSGKVGVVQKAKSFLADIKSKFVDDKSQLEDILNASEKKYNYQVLPKDDVRLQIDRVLRSKTLAGQFVEDNGLARVIKDAPDLDALDQYMIAKQAATVAKNGVNTGRDLVRDQQLIQDLAPQYESHAQAVNQYSRKLLDYAVETGLISRKLADDLITKYPDYVPLQRIFNELEQPNVPGSGRGVASISSQSVVKNLKGSDREIASPIESLLLKTQDALAQGERNKAAGQLAKYKDLPGFEGLIAELAPGAKAPHTISFLDNGVKRTFAVTKEIEAVAKSLDEEQMGFIVKLFSYPTRALQVGATGLNVPFVVTNIVKDEISGFINSNKAARTSIMNPANYVRALFSAVKHDGLYKDLVRNAAGGTSFDISRQATNLSVSKIRNPIKYTVTRPGELLRAIEDIVGRSEELGRIKNFEGTRQALLKEGRTLQDANLLAAKAGRDTTTNFARAGSWGKVIKYVIPFFNAGIQGARQLDRSFQNAPAQTSAKVALTIFTPIAAATAWNLSDPKRKQIYQDIPEYEKQNNIILIPENPTQDEQGRWNVIKIPLPPGLSNLGSLVRRPMEQAEGLDPVKFAEIAHNLITATTSIDASSPNKLASTFTPQGIKPVVEATTNTNLFTGQKIVPEYLKNQPPELQTRPGVSGVATNIGGALGVSPLMVENFAQTQLGGLGSQLLGKETVAGNLEKRFSKASGGNTLDKVYNDSTKVQSIESGVRKLVEAGNKEAAIKLIQDNKEVLIRGKQAKAVRSQVDQLQAAKNKVKADTRLSQEQKDKVLTLIQQRLYDLSNQYQALQK